MVNHVKCDKHAKSRDHFYKKAKLNRYTTQYTHFWVKETIYLFTAIMSDHWPIMQFTRIIQIIWNILKYCISLGPKMKRLFNKFKCNIFLWFSSCKKIKLGFVWMLKNGHIWHLFFNSFDAIWIRPHQRPFLLQLQFFWNQNSIS